MHIYENNQYIEDVVYVANLELPWERLKDSSILISGASGMMGLFLIDVIMHKNLKERLNCLIYALGRNEEKAKQRFENHWEKETFYFVQGDINEILEMSNVSEVDYVLHLASNTHPAAYATDPIGTITTNIIGLKNILDFGDVNNVKRCLFASSNEIYGENRGDIEIFDEEYCGYINCNTMRAGYPESKCCGEALCQAYIKQKNLDIVIARLTRSYGPTMLLNDTKAISQFIIKAINGEDVVLKSQGLQYYSYTYVADAVAGLLRILLCGEKGEAYNIADVKSDILLKNLAEIIAKTVNRRVLYEIPDEVERVGYSTATKARLSGEKLKKLGWIPKYDIEEGIVRTISILKEE